MEEILASIRRIISEDGTEEREEGAPDASPAENEAGLDAAPEAPDPVEPGDEDAAADVLELTDVVEDSETEPEPDPGTLEEAAEMTSETAADEADEEAALVSATAGTAASAEFARLSEATTEETRVTSLPLGQGDRTVEEIVRELLRPMLREWLDANLPTLVEEIVEREVQRLSRDARRR